MTGSFARLAIAAVIAALCAAPARAQEPQVAAAKREGALTLYSSMPVEVAEELTAAFRKTYGIPVSMWRGGSEEILQRAVTEARAGRHAVDVIETAGPEMEALAREKLLRAVDLPAYAGLMPGAHAAGRPWVTGRLSVFVTAYNTHLVRAGAIPKTYEGFADPAWKGRLGLVADDANWLMGLATEMGEARTLALFRAIVAANGVSLRKGHTLLANMLVSGEVPLTFTGYIEQIAALKRAGAPVDMDFIAPVIAMPTAAAVTVQAPHPNAAALFLGFYLMEGQKILAAHDYVPARLSAQTLPEGVAPRVMDVGAFLDSSEKWRALFRETFAARR
jgi:iron(III) transport system substrate-binding protein